MINRAQAKKAAKAFSPDHDFFIEEDEVFVFGKKNSFGGSYVIYKETGVITGYHDYFSEKTRKYMRIKYGKNRTIIVKP